MPRLYREMPLASIWEGSGDVMALEVLRALKASPGVLTAFLEEIDEADGADRRLDAFTASLRDEFADVEAIELRARRVVERMALALQGSLLVRHAPAAVADTFCASWLAGDAGLQYGTPAALRRRAGDPRPAHAAGVLSRAAPRRAVAPRGRSCVTHGRLVAEPRGRHGERRSAPTRSRCGRSA